MNLETTLTLIVPVPLRDLFRACACFCEVACCGLEAFDVNPYTTLWWIREAGQEAASEAQQQLEGMIRLVAAHRGPVDGTEEFGHQWVEAQHCAAYLTTWCEGLIRAQALANQGTPPPEQRLAEAKHEGHRAYYLAVRRLCAEASRLLNDGDLPKGMALHALIAGLDANDGAISDEVRYSQRVLAERRSRPTRS